MDNTLIGKTVALICDVTFINNEVIYKGTIGKVIEDCGGGLTVCFPNSTTKYVLPREYVWIC